MCSVLKTYLIRNSSKHICVCAQEKGLQDRGQLVLVGDWSTMEKRAGHLRTVDGVAKDLLINQEKLYFVFQLWNKTSF